MELHLTPLRNILLPLLLLAPLPAVAAPPGEKNPGSHAAGGSSEGQLKWLVSLPEALAEAKKRDTYILVDLYAEWCGWCKQLEKKVFTTPEFAARVKDFVLLRVDTEDGADGARLQALHDASSLPTTLILDAKGVRIGQINGFAPTKEFIGYIDQQMNGWKEMLSHYPGLLASQETATQLEVAKELHQRQDGERSAALYEAVAKTLDPQSSTYAWLHYMLADSYRLDRRFDQAEKTIEKARAVLAKAEEPAMLGEQLDLLRYYIAQDKSDCREARSSLEIFLEAHPSSQLRPRLQKTLNELRLDSKCT
jgi:thioredoxin-like negative regulator of GroEL